MDLLFGIACIALFLWALNGFTVTTTVSPSIEYNRTTKNKDGSTTTIFAKFSTTEELEEFLSNLKEFDELNKDE